MGQQSNQPLHLPIQLYVGEEPESDRFARRLTTELRRLQAEARQEGRRLRQAHKPQEWSEEPLEPEAERQGLRPEKERLSWEEQPDRTEQPNRKEQLNGREQQTRRGEAHGQRPAVRQGWLAAGLKPLPEGVAPLWMNRGAAAFAARSASAAAWRLSMAGLVPAMESKRRAGYRRRFEVTVFGLRAVHVAEVSGVGAGWLGANARTAAGRIADGSAHIAAGDTDGSSGTRTAAEHTAGSRAHMTAGYIDSSSFHMAAGHTAGSSGSGSGGGRRAGVSEAESPLMEPDSPLFRRLEKMAIKALYAQGLDFAQVTLEAGDSGWEIAGITTFPDLRAYEAARAFAEAVLQMAEEWRLAAETANSLEALPSLPSNDNPFSSREAVSGRAGEDRAISSGLLLGMDPEFLLFDPAARKIIPASRFLSREGVAGCDSVWIRGRRRFPLAELRPDPAGEPEAAIRQLMGAMREAARQIGDAPLAWLAGGLPQPGLPLGGHLHFSGVLLTPQLLRALDHFLAIPAAVLEDSRSASRRPRYGCLGDFRRQSHGGFEYRTLPSFLVSPVVAKGTVALALLVASAYKSGTLPEVPPEHAAALKAFYTGDRTALRPFALQALEQAEALPSFSRYKPYIDPMFKAIRAGRTWDESVDIRKVWKLEGHSPIIRDLS
ncbi:putative amidoligase domain-containing protein [Paenibacillus physcomitrellae]|uniref:Phage phiEco32-like COOH-NH2 ligase-type 2 n=1 Tax=Paenibacillus physcomitrellae TaxID=1619311 RepID=A0ABQ1FQA3_9BACL|nr:hypothetical protein [Paenibacillus physcomitrellae]GGA24747.1 hypothetical protein GCM10010917_07020 [Paenibacillus physcomitrellae]